MRKKSAMTILRQKRRVIQCRKCYKLYKDNCTHKCISFKTCPFCYLIFRKNHKRYCPYYIKMSKIKKLKELNRKKYIYNHIEQIGFLNEREVNPVDITDCENKNRILGNGSTLLYASEINNKPHYLNADELPEITQECLIPNDILTFPKEVPGNCYVVVVGHEEVQLKTRNCIKDNIKTVLKIYTHLLYLCDPITEKLGKLCKALFVSHNSDCLPKFNYMSIIRFHRVLLFSSTSNCIILCSAPNFTSWIILKRGNKDKIICKSSKTYTWDYQDDLLFTSYSNYAESLILNKTIKIGSQKKHIKNMEEDLCDATDCPEAQSFEYSLYSEVYGFNKSRDNESKDKNISKSKTSKFNSLIPIH